MLKSGNADEEIVRYVCDHRDVVLTIYDASGAKDERNGVSAKKKECGPAGGTEIINPPRNHEKDLNQSDKGFDKEDVDDGKNFR
jgi:hypothetical protein